MQIKIPELNSRYIPVHGGYGHVEKHMNWWSADSPYLYEFGLFNLLHFKKEQMNIIRGQSPNMFILTDSGGFQVVSGTCNLNWETSILQQIRLKASKIFSLDKPTVHQKASEGSLTNFVYMNDTEAFATIKDNFDVALKQSKYLKEKYPEEFKKFCYIMQGKSINQIDYNMNLFKEELGGVDKYLEYFPGGIVYASKGGDNLFISMAARHAYDNFVSKGIYVHFLGMGSFYRMIILIRNMISTFDSSTLLQGVRVNEFINPLNLNNTLQLSSENLSGFTKEFCVCPVCSVTDYHDLMKNDKQEIGRKCTMHNLWHLLKMNIFLDSIPKDNYTTIIIKNFKISDDVKRSLEFLDCCDQYGFNIAYNKYKHYLKKDITKQTSLF